MAELMKYFAFLFITQFSFGQEIAHENQLLWEISGNGLKQKSYLYGSFHTNDKRVFKLSDSTYYAINRAEAIVLETDVTELFVEWDTRRDDVQLFYDENGNPYTSSRNASKTLYGNEDGMPQFLDAYFHQYCFNAGKIFHPLETVQDQLDLLGGKSDYIPSYNEMESRVVSQEKVLDLYLKGDIYGLDKLMRTSLMVYPGLYDELILDRNKLMAQGIDSLLKQKSLFIAVGAGHLAGEKGIINLLRAKGYKVRKVTSTFSVYPTEEKERFLQAKEYKYTNQELGLNAIFPGKPVIYDVQENAWKMIYREMGQGNTYQIEVIEKNEGTLESVAADYIRSPRTSKISIKQMDEGAHYAEGLSDTYPEGLSWIRIIEAENHMVIIKTYGGNKFMNSKRPQSFFNKVWIE